MISNAPTDNLYKFVTFLGVALIMFCSWSYSEAMKRFESTTIENYARQLKTAERQTNVNLKLDQMRANNADPSLSKEIRDAKNKTLVTEILALAQEAKDAAYSEMQPELVLLQNQDDVKIYEYGIGFGLSMTLVGAFLWYILHQRHQDALLREQVREAKAARKAKPAASTVSQPAPLPRWRRVMSLNRVH
ncbi:hypothetical protein G6L15_16240 [Agrobacterium rhizogenes]|jgi:hypothetical protein|uniref:hypothetical protein n=1 Tax=Rhizobium rhizogenes TaxID=359 RepID=UPI0015720146|nr:hypothetical protein [Rhizobium rhizogenes]